MIKSFLITSLCLSILLLPAPLYASPLIQLNQKIELTADSMTVDQKALLATLSGHVEATQGPLTIKADIMKIYYASYGENPTINRIELEGNIVLHNKDQKAQGSWGQYDVEKHTITLEGNVILTQGKNVIKAYRLIHDTSNGKSTVINEDTPGQKSRVRAVFTPAQKE